MAKVSEYDDTQEGAPAIPVSKRAVSAAKAREMRDDPRFKELRTKFRAEGSRHRNPDGTTGAPCWLCGGDIDYKLKYPHPFSWSLDHAVTVKERPDLLMDALNFRHCHYDCNLGRGTDEPTLDTGKPSRIW